MFKKLILTVLMMAPLSLLAQKVAHFNSNEILSVYPAAKTVQTELEALGKQYQSDIEAMQKEFQAKLDKFKKEVTDKTPANMRERKETELQDLQQKIQQAVQDNETAFRKATQTKMQPVQEKVVAAINDILKEGNYAYGIDEATVQGIILNKTLTTDITAQIKAKLGIK